MTEGERIAAVGLGLQHFLAKAWAAEPDTFPPLETFFPDTPVDEPAPLTFDDWARHLLPLAGGGI